MRASERVRLSTCVRVDAECRHRGVFVHEAIRDLSIGALVCIHSVNLQDERPRRLVLQDRRALSVLLALGGQKGEVGGGTGQV